ncbi:MAG TPA: DUF2255 family protein [Bacteroidia bacterium]|nr:DUF2255 family protein [Bacteroidia bacterium]
MNYIRNNNLIGIKAGKERDTFLEIWMVVVDDRIFARSWGMAEKSWYNTLKENSQGFLKCGNKIFEMKAIIPVQSAALTEKINKAYLDKYDSGENSFYAKGIIKQEHVAKTMEFELLPIIS